MVAINVTGTVVNDFALPQLDISVDGLTGRPTRSLSKLYESYVSTARGLGLRDLERLTTAGGIPDAFGTPIPMEAYATNLPFCRCGYAGSEAATLDTNAENLDFMREAMNPRRRRAAGFERLLDTNALARAQFEARVGGNVIASGMNNDGVLSIQRYATGYQPSAVGVSMNPMQGSIFGALFGMDQAIMQQAGQLAMLESGGGGYFGYAAAGFSNVYGAGAYDNSGAMGGQGYGSWNPNAMPGLINNTNPSYEAAHQADTANLLADPSLTVEDKVTLLIMLIMNKMDQDIERQAQYINSIQQQQAARGGIGGQAAGLAAGTGTTITGSGTDSPSIDVETMKLKRMIDKRSQMFDMLRQIIDKYNQTAKGIIDSIGR